MVDGRGQPVARAGVLGGKTDEQVDGLAAETAAKYYAQLARGLSPPEPTEILVFVDGVERGVGPGEDARVTPALAKLLPIMGRVARGLRVRGVRLRGARCRCRYRADSGDSSTDLSVDLRVRFRRKKGIAELKWHELSLRPAKTRARAMKGELRRAAERGVWQGPHPRCGKSAAARLIGAVAVSRSGWWCRLWKVRGRKTTRYRRWQVQHREQESGAKLRKRRREAAQDGEEGEEPAPKRPRAAVARSSSDEDSSSSASSESDASSTSDEC